ncbi:MAG: amidohydrolase family protein [Luteimonas sp.]
MTVFVNARIFDGESRALRDGLNVFVKANLIAEVSARPPNPDDGEAIDCGARTLMPGLIDAHIHAYAHSVNFFENVSAPPTLATGWATRMLGRMLDRGFTTVRDTGGADYGLFLALQRKYIRGPRLYYCGKALSQTGGHADGRNPHHQTCADTMHLCGCGATGLIALVVDGVDAVRKAVRENLFRGSNFIKFTGSGGVSSMGDSLGSIQFSDEEVIAMVDEVERHGAYCTSHVIPDAAIKRAIKLGVHCLEHGTLIERDTARMAADKGTYIVPTMAIIASLARRGRELGYPPQAIAKLALVKDEALPHLQYMKDAGVKIGFGTDLLGDLEEDQCTEFALRSPIFSNHELLVQATSMNAEIIGAKGKLGVIKPGAFADVLLVDGDPLSDIQVLAQDGATMPVIMKDGKFVKRAPLALIS